MLENLAKSPIFWVLMVLAIVFIAYKGIKKSRQEKKQKNQREKEVKNLIKKHVAKKDQFFNVSIEYEEVIARSGPLYRSRDVFDVFIRVLNPKDNKIIAKKAYEIEGVARKNPNSPNKDDILVDWSINEEYNYDRHFRLIKYTPPSKWKIWLRSITKKNRQKYRITESTKLKEWKKQQKEHGKQWKRKQKEAIHEKAFKPTMKKKS